MKSKTAWQPVSLSVALSVLVALPGCRLHDPAWGHGMDDDYFQTLAHQIQFHDVTKSLELADRQDIHSLEPFSIHRNEPSEYWDLSEQEAMQIALSNSRVLRDLGGTVIRSPANARTMLDPEIRASDPRFGVEAALSEFDATFSTNSVAEKNDRALNNQFFGGGTRLLQEDFWGIRSQISKRTVTGSQFTIRNNTDYNRSNAPGNRFGSAWNTNYEAEIRQPLLQGRGVLFNRIAGPGSITGVANGVLVAIVNTDIQLADFQLGLRDFVSNVQNVYWDLYFAYRNLDAKIAARDASLETWRTVNAFMTSGRRGGEAYREAQAREQYFRFQLDVENALTGRLLEPTRTYNGSSGGTFRGTSGVYVAERRLRLIMGLPSNDGRLIRPSDEPPMAKYVFDWSEVMAEALARRAELRKQQLQIRRRDMDLLVSRNFLLPRLDTVGLYRWRGFGHDLISTSGSALPFDNAYQDLLSGDFQEWQLGLELTVPIGFRRAHAAVRNAQLRLARERAILEEQQREVVSDLSEAFADVERTYQTAQTSFNIRESAKDQLDAVQAAFDADQAPLDQVLDAQRRLADSESRYFAALVEYQLAIRNIHFEKGSLLDYNDVYLVGSPTYRHSGATLAGSALGRQESELVDYVLTRSLDSNQVDSTLPDRQAADNSPTPTPATRSDESSRARLRAQPFDPKRVPSAAESGGGVVKANFKMGVDHDSGELIRLPQIGW